VFFGGYAAENQSLHCSYLIPVMFIAIPLYLIGCALAPLGRTN
jgi:hypothetical protein